MWGRFSGSTESVLNQDLKALEEVEGGLDRLIEQLRLWHGSLTIQPAHFSGWSLGARFYPVLYALTRVGDAKDWGTGLPLKSHLLGKMNALEVHHIFPKALLYKHGYARAEVNAVANFCFLTKDTNLQISDHRPADYLPEIEAKHPGALASQWIPTDPELWQVENYPQFLEERRRLLAGAANSLLAELLHEAPGAEVVDEVFVPVGAAVEPAAVEIPGGVESAEEEALLIELNEWVLSEGLPEGHLLHELAHPDTGEPVALLDLAWPNGLQEGYSQPVAVLLDERERTLEVANDHGFRYFTSVETFKAHVQTEVLAEDDMTAAAGG